MGLRYFQVVMIQKVFRICLFLFLFSTTSCGYVGTNAGKGFLTGGLVGAGAGALVGTATGTIGPAIAIGAGFGAISGGLIGSSMDIKELERKRIEEEKYLQQIEIDRQNREIEDIRRQQRYDDAFQRY
jgi:Na+/glutamate symporter